MKLWIVSLLASLAACAGKDPYNPGAPLGSYAVNGKLVANGCGAGDGASDPWAFSVKLSKDGSTLYWIQGGLPVSGHIDASSHATMSSTSSQTIHGADPRSGAGACTIERHDALDLTLASDAASFAGTITYTFAPSDGSDCTDQLAAAGGSFAILPCSVGYTLQANRTATK